MNFYVFCIMIGFLMGISLMYCYHRFFVKTYRKDIDALREVDRINEEIIQKYKESVAIHEAIHSNDVFFMEKQKEYIARLEKYIASLEGRPDAP